MGWDSADSGFCKHIQISRKVSKAVTSAFRIASVDFSTHVTCVGDNPAAVWQPVQLNVHGQRDKIDGAFHKLQNFKLQSNSLGKKWYWCQTITWLGNDVRCNFLWHPLCYAEVRKCCQIFPNKQHRAAAVIHDQFRWFFNVHTKRHRSRKHFRGKVDYSCACSPGTVGILNFWTNLKNYE